MSDTANDFLAHYGVAGMKWGKHKAKSSKPSTEDILSARYRQEARGRKLQEAQGDFFVARTAKGQDKAEKIMRQHEKTYFNNPDAATAAKMTKGEKVVTGIYYGLAAVTVASIIATHTK